MARAFIYSNDELLEMLRNYLKRNGVIPTGKLIDEDVTMPSSSVYVNRFGGIAIALHAAGIDVDGMIDIAVVDPYAHDWAIERKKRLAQEQRKELIKRSKEAAVRGKWVITKLPNSHKPKVNGWLTDMVVGKE